MAESARHPAFSTLGEMFVKTAGAGGWHQAAFLSKSKGRYQSMSSFETLVRVAGLAAGLQDLGVRKGDRVALISENRVEWALSDYALLGLGAIVVPIYPTLLEPEIEFILRDSGSKGVIVSTCEQLRKVLNIRPRLPALEFIVAIEAADSSGTAARTWKEVLAKGPAVGASETLEFLWEKAKAIRPEDTASILYTSGTTGTPKGVVLTHANFASNIQAAQGLFSLHERDVALSFLPLSHVFERTLDYHYFWMGVPIAYAESFDALGRNLIEVRPTVMGVVPRVLEKTHSKVLEAVAQYRAGKQRLFHWAVAVGREYFPYTLDGSRAPAGLRLKHSLADALVFSKIRARLGGRLRWMISGAAPLSRELMEFFYAIGLPVYEGYGLTETSPMISINYPGATRLGTVGRVVRGVEVKLDDQLVDADGKAGKEILVRGPNVTPGYYGLEQETREAFSDGWFRTGDLGSLDAEGFLTITGRKKNLFKTTGGKYVSPEKLENLFQHSPLVSQIMVLGDARKFIGALIVPNFAALEALAHTHKIEFRSMEELVRQPQVVRLFERHTEQVTAWLAPHEKIRQFALLAKEFTLESEELSPTHKIKRHVVEEHYRDLIEAMYQRHAPRAEAAAASA